MNIIILGPQGSGKGTQARLLCDRFNLFYFESGAYLRKVAQNNEKVKEMIDSGIFVPDKEMTSYLTAFLDQEHIYDDILFDGFPRNLEQYFFLKKWLNDKGVKIDYCFVLKISEDETIKRLSSRRVDPVSGKIFNLITDKPPAGYDQSRLVQRDDDKPESIKKRLELYKTRTQPMIEELKKDSMLFEVDGERSIEKINEDLVLIINQHSSSR